MIIVYGGCQADEPEQDTPRLPSDAAEDLFVRIRGLLQSLEPKSLVGALASGADILFARAALAEGIPLEIRFPSTSRHSARQAWSPLENPGSATTTGSPPLPVSTIDDAGLDPADADVYRKHNIALLDKAEALDVKTDQRVWVLAVRPQPNPLSPTRD